MEDRSTPLGNKGKRTTRCKAIPGFFMQYKGRISQSDHFRHAGAALYTFCCTEVVNHELPAPAFCGQHPIARGHAFPIQCQRMMKASIKQVVDGGGK